ncbi:MAG: uncharacterized protein QOK29_3554 [Rhodospirillaceae bacterium]|jgi:uncharacterized membrane protein YfcA|nr:uncharacterized protein [Rhodospirillaceae bacterium]
MDIAGIPYVMILLVAGIACGLINTLASSGSAVSLPILMMLGLPPLAANATNRLSVLFGSLMALKTFHSQGKIDWAAAAKMVLPATLGSVIGVWVAEMLPARDMGLAIVAAVLVALLLLFSKLKAALARDQVLPAEVTPPSLFAVTFVGFWLGFLVLDGATYLLLVLILLCRFDLPHANALKVFLLVATTLVPIVLFARSGDIWWKEGLLLSIGSILGGYIGARLSSFEGARVWVFRILVVVIGLELIHLGIHYFGTSLYQAMRMDI